ncbi:2Fe-2S iron-sulfur cluster binding domain-containing protein [Psychrobacter sp. HD31]|uniref:2Fe-2S iron-sulfur cluster-binding protein n=1 Tax=Psychrobacter sp. HD31 TaxID=3112003 RepID=UPI003DA3BFFB
MTAYQIKLTTTDGQTLSFDCDEDKDVITAAQEEDIYLVAQCHSGACGACIGKLTSGDITHTNYSKDALPSAEREQGQVLLCCTHPKQDLTINLPYAHSAVQFEKKPQREAEIISKTYLTKDTVKLDLQLLPDEDDNLILDFEPGQFMELHIPDDETPHNIEDIKRAYSIANAPNWDGSLEFIIKLREQGKFSGFLHQKAEAGIKIKLDGAMGTFMLHDNGLRPRYFIAGGCGLASVMSMLRRMAEWQEPQPVKLFFGVWAEQDVFFEQEIANLAKEYPQLDYQICVTQANNAWSEDKNHYTGSVVNAFDAAMQLEDTTPDIYICGSPNLIDAVANTAKKHGIEQDALIYERYLANEQPTGAARCDVLK